MSTSLVRMKFAAVAAKIEVTPGTDAIGGTPAAADWIASEMEVQFDPTIIELPELTGSLDRAPAVVGGLGASRLLMLTDVLGVLDKQKELIPEMTLPDVQARLADGTITGGMIPKVENCVDAVQRGVKGVVILDGRQPHACLLGLFTEGGYGTLIKA